jgi:branched-chain amino acid transport system substrate-binding protein
LISFESYETISILIDAIKRSGDASPAAIRDALASTKYKSMLDTTLEFDANNLIHNNAIIFEIKGGKVVIVGMSKT